MASVAVFCCLRWHRSKKLSLAAPKLTQASPEVVSGIEVGSDAMPKVSLAISSIAVAESW